MTGFSAKPRDMQRTIGKVLARFLTNGSDVATRRSQRDHPRSGRARREAERGRSARVAEQQVRRARLRQASVTWAMLTPAERASLRAMTAADCTTRRLPASPPALPGPGSARPSSSQRRPTGIALTAAGAILWLAVHTRIAFVASRPAGLVLLVTGLLWLWIPVPAKRDLLRRGFRRVMSYLAWDPAAAGVSKCSIEDLLGPPAGPVSCRLQVDAAESDPQRDQRQCP